MKMTIEIKGLDETIASLKTFDAEAIKVFKSAIRATAYATAKGARQGASGSIKEDVKVRIRNDGLTAFVSVGNFIGKFIEFGTGLFGPKGKAYRIPRLRRKQQPKPIALPWGKVVESITHPGIKPKPFLFPSWENEKPKFAQRMRQAIKRAEKKAARGAKT